MRKVPKFNNSGFTVLEVAVAVSLFSFIILLSGNMYSLAQRSYRIGSGNAELVQNARVALDRMSREIRQSGQVVTALPPDKNNPLLPPRDDIFFQDGHSTSQTKYIRYYLDANHYLWRSVIVYYFSSEPDNYVAYNAKDLTGNSPDVELTIEDRMVGEYFNQLAFWGGDGLVNIEMRLIKDDDNFSITTSAYSRNY